MVVWGSSLEREELPLSSVPLQLERYTCMLGERTQAQGSEETQQVLQESRQLAALPVPFPAVRDIP